MERREWYGSRAGVGEKGGLLPYDNVYYFAYGSNMNPQRMWYRAPSARAVGVATLRGWRIAERLYADIDRKAGSSVEGVLYVMPHYDLDRIDHFEGSPNVYRRTAVKVECGGRHVEAITYVMTRETKRERNGKEYPSDYRRICSVGARLFRVRDEFVKEGFEKEVA